jgi:hypothetical protein
LLVFLDCRSGNATKPGGSPGWQRKGGCQDVLAEEGARRTFRRGDVARRVWAIRRRRSAEPGNQQEPEVSRAQIRARVGASRAGEAASRTTSTRGRVMTMLAIRGISHLRTTVGHGRVMRRAAQTPGRHRRRHSIGRPLADQQDHSQQGGGGGGANGLHVAAEYR